MQGFDARRYGVDWADIYDSFHEGLVDTPAAVEGLARLVGDGAPVLEYGAGTGRLAIPLGERGYGVVAVDISEPMLAQLHAKPGAERVTTVLADMTEVALGRTFDLAFIALNSIFALPSQEDQVRLFGNAATHLRPGGRFVVEAIVPAEQPLSRIDQLGDRVAITTGRRDPVTNSYTATWVLVGADGITVHPIGGRYVGHGELDLMARLAGLELEHRWSDWAGAPFTATSRAHVSVYRRP